MMDISGFLRYYRKKNHFTQEYVANQLNISRQAISAWENNLAYPDLENLLLLSHLYKITLDDLIGNGTVTGGSSISQGLVRSLEEDIKNLRTIVSRLKDIF